MGVFSVCMLANSHMCAWYHSGQKSISSPLEFELQMVVKDHVCGGSQTWSSGRAASDINLWAITPVSMMLDFKVQVFIPYKEICY